MYTGLDWVVFEGAAGAVLTYGLLIFIVAALCLSTVWIFLDGGVFVVFRLTGAFFSSLEGELRFDLFSVNF